MNEEEQWAFQWKDHPTNDVPLAQGWSQLMGDIGEEGVCVDRTIIDPGRINPVMAQGGYEGHGVPVAMRCEPLQALAFWRPTTQGCHVGLGPGFVDEDQPGWINPTLIPFPPRPEPRHLWPFLLDGQSSFF